MLHRDSTDNHRLERWVYASAAARTAASGFVAGDVSQIAYQSDTGTYWRLTATTPTWAQVGGSSGATALTGLSDVLIATPADGQALLYEAASSKWKNGTVSGGGGSSILPTLTAPVLANFTWANQETAFTIVNTNSLTLVCPVVSGGNASRYLYKAAPATPYQVTVAFNALFSSASTTSHVGLAVRNGTSGTGNAISLGVQQDSSIVRSTRTLPSTLGTSTSLGTFAFAGKGPLTWLRIANDGTTLTYKVSYDGYYFQTLSSDALSAFITTADYIALFCNPPSTGSYPTSVTYFHYLEETGPSAPVVYQAESQAYTNASIYSGGGFPAVSPNSATGCVIPFTSMPFTGNSIKVRYSSGNGTFTVYLDSVKVAKVFCPASGSYSSYATCDTGIIPTTGTHTLEIKFETGDSGNAFTIDWVSF